MHGVRLDHARPGELGRSLHGEVKFVIADVEAVTGDDGLALKPLSVEFDSVR